MAATRTSDVPTCGNSAGPLPIVTSAIAVPCELQLAVHATAIVMPSAIGYQAMEAPSFIATLGPTAAFASCVATIVAAAIA